MSDVPRQPIDFQYGVAFDEGVEVQFGVAFDSVPVVFQYEFVVVMTVPRGMSIRSIMTGGGFDPHPQPTPRNKGTLGRSQWTLWILLLGNDARAFLLQTVQYLLAQFHGFDVTPRLFEEETFVPGAGGETQSEPVVVEPSVEEGAYVVEAVFGVVFQVG